MPQADVIPLPLTVEDLADEAGLPGCSDATWLDQQAAQLFCRTMNLMRQQGDPATLASIAIEIHDRRLRIRFLEHVGAALIHS